MLLKNWKSNVFGKEEWTNKTCTLLSLSENQLQRLKTEFTRGFRVNQCEQKSVLHKRQCASIFQQRGFLWMWVNQHNVATAHHRRLDSLGLFCLFILFYLVWTTRLNDSERVYSWMTTIPAWCGYCSIQVTICPSDWKPSVFVVDE